jgi:iron-sulfur cluster assembly protein
MGITVTEAAAAHVSRNLDKRGSGLGIRVGVRTSGCSGMAYVLEFVDEAIPEDHYEGHGIRVYVDPKSLVYLEGTELDFAKEGLNEGFQFKNPNAAAECGCGESFTI